MVFALSGIIGPSQAWSLLRRHAEDDVAPLRLVDLRGGGGGGSVDCLVSIFDPSTLGGALQIIGEGSRFAPDFIGPTLAAVLERVGGDGVVAVSFESYFVDPVYRSNPKVRLLTLTLSLARRTHLKN